jgi:molybdate transport system substrate-binding protein
MKYLLWPAVVALVLGNLGYARAQGELVVVAPGIGRAALEQLITGFERKTGYKVTVIFGNGVETNQKAARGEAFDVAVVQSPYPVVLASGNITGDKGTLLAKVPLAVAVRHGALKPDISTREAVKRMLLAAKSISGPDPSGGSATGVSGNEVLKKLGIAEQIQPKLKPYQGGSGGAVALVAKGEAEISLAFLTEMTNPGIDVVGPLPREISTYPALVGFVSSHTKDPKAANTLLDYLSTPEAAAVYKAQGMEPGP